MHSKIDTEIVILSSRYKFSFSIVFIKLVPSGPYSRKKRKGFMYSKDFFFYFSEVFRNACSFFARMKTSPNKTEITMKHTAYSNIIYMYEIFQRKRVYV